MSYKLFFNTDFYNKEEGSRFGHFGGFVLDFTMFILYMLVDQPYFHRNQMV